MPWTNFLREQGCQFACNWGNTAGARRTPVREPARSRSPGWVVFFLYNRWKCIRKCLNIPHVPLRGKVVCKLYAGSGGRGALVDAHFGKGYTFPGAFPSQRLSLSGNRFLPGVEPYCSAHPSYPITLFIIYAICSDPQTPTGHSFFRERP